MPLNKLDKMKLLYYIAVTDAEDSEDRNFNGRSEYKLTTGVMTNASW